jgi:hypothetical protein
MVKAVILFLVVMAAIALIGNAISPGSFWRQVGKTTGMRRCPRCGRPLIGKASCDCGKKG